MKFGNITYLLALWIVPALIFFYLYAFKMKDRLLSRFATPELLLRLMPVGIRKRQIAKATFIIGAIFFIIIALIRPKWGYHWEDVKRMGIDIVIVLDMSKSMLAEDVKPNRLERAKREIHDLIRLMQGDRVGLVVFSGLPFVQCPLTMDYGALQMFLDDISPDDMPLPGTAIGAALQKAMDAFNDKEKKSKAIILITDGEDHEGQPLEVAKEAKKRGIKIFAIGVGQEGGAPVPDSAGGGFKKDESGNMALSKLDETVLQKLALETGATYVRSVTGDMDLEKIYQENIKGEMEAKELKNTRQKKWEERFQWFVFIAFLLLLFEFFLPEWVKKRGQHETK